jgi:translation initiation factor 2B subunit (eIF-2B alpha/beta/delta family)
MNKAKKETIIKMMETLPDYLQDETINHLREYISEMNDELRWNKSFEQTQGTLIKAARKAKEEIKNGKSVIMDFDNV